MRESDFVGSLDTSFTIHLRLADVPLRVEVNHPRLEALITQYFGPFVGEPADSATRVVGIQGEAEIDHSALLEVPRAKGLPKAAFYHRDDMLVILKKRSDVVYYIHGGEFFAVGDLVGKPQQLCNLVASAFSYRLRSRGWTTLHASGVATTGRGIAFAGPSGSAKSTLALAMLDMGYSFVSNDRVSLLHSGDRVQMAGVPKWPRVNPGTLLAISRLRGLVSEDKMNTYTSLPPSQLWEVEDKHDVPVDRIYGSGRLALMTELDLLYVLSWRRNAGPVELRSVPEHEVGHLLATLVKSELIDPPHLSPPSPLQLSRTLSGVRVVEVSGGIDVFQLAQQVPYHHSTSPWDIVGFSETRPNGTLNLAPVDAASRNLPPTGRTER